MFVHFTIYDTKYNPPNNVKYIAKNSVYLLLGISKCKLKCVSWIWKFGYLALEKLWKSIGIFLKEFVRTLEVDIV